MKKRLLISILFLGVSTSPAIVPTTDGLAADRNFTAHASGAAAGVATPAQGEAKFQLNDDGTVLQYRLIAANIENVTQAHIHQGAPGTNGPVVAWLYPAAPPSVLIPGRFDGVLAAGVITEANLVGPLAGQPFNALIETMNAGETYVNVHTSQYPAGEIRGQIR